ncbi:vWA domain-containing protein [Levilactobacillus bambusae]|uniref:VWA-like domain-containing protein n=1 Tax=Levilactobacillus bambusae TaxID=2024736 RepID=A0A2V1N0W1_9LACO|nr:VWA-like domain-containing protein [Levilactobacillus bambusae]PWG00899.1 hypothetical protein DCM90_01620 [Levilactobacillus bambusae]
MTGLEQALAHNDGSQGAGDQILSLATVELLRTDRFYGEVLARLPKQAATLTAPLGLTSQGLLLDNHQLSQSGWSAENLLAGLKHLVLHLVWRHPERYGASSSQQSLIDAATDIAINQYLTDLPATALTRQKLSDQTGLKFLPDQDSNAYLMQLRDWQPTRGNQKAQRSDQSASASQTQSQTASKALDSILKKSNLDDHQKWNQRHQSSDQELTQLLKAAWQATPKKNRGTLPGQVSSELKRLDPTQPVDWRRIIRFGAGQVPAGKQESWSRFNRRQPYRMDLPGQTTKTLINVRVYVDESGSMGNEEISRVIGELSGLLRQYPAKITVIPFDTRVHQELAVTQKFQLPKHRVGGGGTRFQSVFDDLHHHQANRANTLAVILTDGYGESEVKTYGMVNVIWLLTQPIEKFSLNPIVGRVVELPKEDVEKW